MNLSFGWHAFVTGGPVSIALVVAFLITSACILIFEDALLRDNGRIVAVLYSFMGFIALSPFLLGLGMVCGLAIAQDKTGGEIAGLAAIAALLNLFWIPLLFLLLLLVGKAYRFKK